MKKISTRFALQVALLLFASTANAEIVNGSFETRTPAGTGVSGTPTGDCITGSGEDVYVPAPWGVQSTPDYSTQAQVAFHNNYQTRTALSPAFDASSNGGCFMGFRSSNNGSNEGLYQTVTIADASEPLKWSFEYTEYTEPGETQCTPSVELRVNGIDDTTPGSVSVGFAPTVGAPGGPTAEGKWVTVESAEFTPSTFGVADGGTLDVYLGVTGNGCRNTWGFVDGVKIISAIDIDYSDSSADGTAAPNGTPSASAYGVATHTIVSGVQLGASITAETSSIEGADNASDDGVNIPPLILGVGGFVTVDVSGTGGYLQGWIDWNQDGVFSTALGSTERLLTDIQDGGPGDADLTTNGQISFTVTPALATPTGTTYARFRWSTDSTVDGIGSATAASDGEVEDYPVTISAGGPPPNNTPQSCSSGVGGFADWSNSGGTGTFSSSGINLPVLPNFSFVVTGDDNGTSVDSSETFTGTNQFEAIYGQADSEENLNVRVRENAGNVGDPIDRSTQLKITFDSDTPSSGWAFLMHDFDDDQATISAKDANGNAVSNAVIGSWFIELFDPNPSGGTQLAVWDSANVTVVGAGTSGVNTRTTTIRNTNNSIEAPGIWFQPNISLSELSIQFESVTKVDASYHIYLASCLEQLINAVDDASQTITAGTSGTISVLTNDTLNGTAVTTSTVTISANPVIKDSSNNAVTGITLDSNGLISVGSAVAADTYTVSYEICENPVPSSICDTAVATMVVVDAIAVPTALPGCPLNRTLIDWRNSTPTFTTVTSAGSQIINSGGRSFTLTYGNGVNGGTPRLSRYTEDTPDIYQVLYMNSAGILDGDDTYRLEIDLDGQVSALGFTVDDFDYGDGNSSNEGLTVIGYRGATAVTPSAVPQDDTFLRTSLLPDGSVYAYSTSPTDQGYRPSDPTSPLGAVDFYFTEAVDRVVLIRGLAPNQNGNDRTSGDGGGIDLRNVMTCADSPPPIPIVNACPAVSVSGQMLIFEENFNGFTDPTPVPRLGASTGSIIEAFNKHSDHSAFADAGRVTDGSNAEFPPYAQSNVLLGASLLENGSLSGSIRHSSFTFYDGINLLSNSQKWTIEADFYYSSAQQYNEFGAILHAPGQDAIWQEDVAGSIDAIHSYRSSLFLLRSPDSSRGASGNPASGTWSRTRTTFYVENTGGVDTLYGEYEIAPYTNGVLGSYSSTGVISFGAASAIPWLNNASLGVAMDSLADNICVYGTNAAQTLSGTIFEDINYGGGAGRDQPAASGIGVNDATVELYDNTGVLVATTTTANNGSNDGAYEFSSVADGNYYIRVVNNTVSSTRLGANGSELAVQTFRTDGTTAVANEVGGRQTTLEDANTHDAANASTLNTTNYAFAGGALDGDQAQSVTPITVAGGDITGVDFGYNFDTVVNTNDAGQGSLRQFIFNSNLLTDETSLSQVGQTAGWETSIFMIPSANLTSGVATIQLNSALPLITGSSTAVDGGTQTGNIGNTNAGVSGTGGTVGVDNLPLPQYANPEVEIDSNDHSGLRVDSAGEVLIARLAIYDTDAASPLINKAGVGLTAASKLTIENAFIGPRATGADPGLGERLGRTYDDIDFTNAPNVIFRNNLFAYSENSGLHADKTGGNYLLTGNELHHLAMNNSGQDAVDAGGTWTATGNLMHNNGSASSSPASGGAGFELGAANNDQVSANSVIENNTLHNNFGPGVRLRNTVFNTVVRKNVIYQNLYAGVQVQLRSTGVGVEAIISQNSIYNNDELGIDISHNTSNGSPDQVTLNDANDADSGPNAGLNFPQFTRAVRVGSDLIIQGCAPAGSTVELFGADVSPSSSSGASVGDNRFTMNQDYGEGETYLTSLVEGVGEDNSLTAVNCSALTDVDGNSATGMSSFQWRIAMPPSLQLGDKLTATATVSGTGTSEFSAVAIIAGQDFGDAPNSYKTLLASNGARHDIVNDVYLGSIKPDAENDGQPNAAATGDGTDEDGISIFNTLTSSDNSYQLTAKVNNASSKTATLLAWIDFDGNGSFDADEAAIRTIPAGATASNYTLTWSSIPVDRVAGDTYLRVRLTTDTLTNQDPNGSKLDGEVEDYAMSIVTAGVTVSGRVYRDVNVNGVSDAGEVGVTNLPVVLYNTATQTCVSTRTDGNGHYQFKKVAPGNYRTYEASRERVPVPTNCDPALAKDPSGYRSTTANARAAFDVVGSDISGEDFGDVKPPAFAADQRGQVLAGNVVFYPHKLTTPTTGTVSFNSVSSGNVSAGWSSIVYQDANCNGVLDAAEASSPLTSSVAVDANTPACLINKVYAPSNVAANDTYQQVITATFDYNNSLAGTHSLKVTDVSTAQQVQAPTVQATPPVVAAPATPAQPAEPATPETPYTPPVDEVPAQQPVAATPVVPEVGPSRLELRKTVRNVDKGSAETATVNVADPGDTLEYKIYYSNSGTGPLSDLVINDNLPEYTEIVGTSASLSSCGTVPAGMTCTRSSVGLDGDLRWTFTGSLVGGAGSFVSYQVKIDN